MLSLIQYIKKPSLVMIALLTRIGSSLLPDKLYLKWLYRLKMEEPLNLKNPTKFTEKLQWLKLYNRKPEYTTMVDKYAVKEYVAERIGKEYIIPTIGVWDKPEDIPFDELPDKFVLKTTHGGGGCGVVVCKDKTTFDINGAIKKLKVSLQQDIYKASKEWPYKNVPRRIIAEQFMEDCATNELRDYKFFCFGGQCKCFKVDFDRFIEHHANYYDSNGYLLNFGESAFPPLFDKQVQLPITIEKMVQLAEELSEKTPFMRTDFYDVDGKVYFGEMTFYPASGLEKFTPEEYDTVIGQWLQLPNRGGYIVINQSVITILESARLANSELNDYKFYCFNGVPKVVMYSSGRFTDNLCFDYYDMDWKKLSLVWDRPNSTIEHPAPTCFQEMKEIVSKLCKDLPHVRVDLYNINNSPYFGELTFFDSSGFCTFDREEWNEKFGSFIELPVNNTCNRNRGGVSACK